MTPKMERLLLLYIFAMFSVLLTSSCRYDVSVQLECYHSARITCCCDQPLHGTCHAVKEKCSCQSDAVAILFTKHCNWLLCSTSAAHAGMFCSYSAAVQNKAVTCCCTGFWTMQRPGACITSTVMILASWIVEVHMVATYLMWQPYATSGIYHICCVSCLLFCSLLSTCLQE